MFFRDTGLSILEPYANWVDFGLGIKHPESLVNFIAAYGTHATITGATTLAGKRAAAQALLDANAVNDNSDFAVDFMNATGDFAGGALGGLSNVDFWMGGLAEAPQPFGGMLGSTFDYVFSSQMLALQNNDRFYYLSRTVGLNVLLQLEQSSMAELVMRNSSAKHLPGDVFATPNHTFEMSSVNPSGTIIDDPTTSVNEALLTRVRNQVRFTGGEHIVMGGTAANNNMRAGAGDDTLYGDEGNDTLEGGAGNDFVLGGAGDDILTDAFGDDQIKGADGNDVISNSSGVDLLFGGDGKDAIFGGIGDAESFAGKGDDFVSAGNGINVVFGNAGNAGNDWIEGGDGADLLWGENGALIPDSTVIGHDVLIGDGNDEYVAEAGDDIMFGTPGVNSADGGLGFDWVTYARSSELVVADLGNSALVPDAVELVTDRYELIEGLSGFNGNDKLTGTDLVAADMDGHELTGEGLARISGLSAVLEGARRFSAGATGLATAFTGGDIILGGGGNDTITGGPGDDVMDGDAWLNTRIQATSNSGVVTSHTSMATLSPGLLNGTINPGNLVIVREILQAAVPGNADVAVYNGVRTRYTITALLDGSRVVTDNVGANGVDLLRNFELIRFADQDVRITSAPINRPASGRPVVSDTTPTQAGVLTLNNADITDADGLGAFSFQWQTSSDGGFSWANIAGATTARFIPVQAQVNTQLRVAVRFTDRMSFTEEVFSLPTDVVGDQITTGATNDSINGTAGADNINAGAGNDSIYGLAGNDTLNGGAGNDTLDGGTGADSMIGGNGNDIFMVDDAGDILVEAAAAGTDTVRSSLASFTLANNLENLIHIGAGATMATGNAAANSITGGAGNDTLNGADGNDTLDGGGGTDSMVGGTGNDTYMVDDAGDILVEAATGGIDTVRSQVASFTLADNLENLIHIGAGATAVTGNGAANVLSGAAGNDTLNGAAGNDTLNGGEGSDSLIGGIGADLLFGGEGADVLSAGGGADVLTGGNGADTLTGGINGDRFVYDTLAEIAGDVITDFEAGAVGADLIDLSAIDANGIEGGNGTFAAALRTTGQAFNAVAQLRVTQATGYAVVEGNTDNVFTTAEFSLRLNGVIAANVLSTDFVR